MSTQKKLSGMLLRFMVMFLALGFLATNSSFAQKWGNVEGASYPGRAKLKTSAKSPVKWGVIHFGKHLFLHSDLDLFGTNGSKRLSFSIPRNWRIREGAELELYISHSPTLMPNLSGLTVLLNGMGLFTTALDRSNVNAARYKIKLPRDKLKDFNVLELRAAQHYMIECEDPFDPTLWTRVHKDSQILIPYEELQPEVDLASFPYPLLDDRDYNVQEVQFLAPPKVSSKILQALATFQASMGRWIKWREFKIKTAFDAPEKIENDLVIIGTYKENPAIMAFAKEPVEPVDPETPVKPEEWPLPLPLRTDIGFTTPDGKAVPADDGVIIFTNHPNDPGRTLLILSGNGEKGVQKAVAAIALMPYEKSITGQALIVRKIDPRPVLGKRTNKTHIPEEQEFTIEDLGFEDITVRGFYSASVVIDLIMEPDTHPVPGEQKFKLLFTYSSQLQNRLSSVEIILNKVSIATKDLSDVEGRVRVMLEVDLPAKLLTPKNKVAIKFHLYPDSYFYCGRTSDRHLWATVHKESLFIMPRDYYTHLPDLSFIGYEWFPYTLYQDLQDTSIVIRDNPDESDIKSLLSIATELGKFTDSEGILLKAFTLSSLPDDVKAANHLIVLDPTPKNEVVTKLTSNSTLIYSGGSKRLLETMEEKELKTVEFKTAGVVEQVNSPFNPEKTLLLIRGRNKASMDLALDAVSDPAKVAKLENNLAFSFDNDEVKTILSTEKKLIGKIPTRKEAQTWVYLNFWVVALIIIAVFILIYIFVALYRMIRKRMQEMKSQIRRRDLR